MIDEADRLLGQSFQDWLRQVLHAIQPPQPDSNPTLGFGTGDMTASSVPNRYFPVADAVAPAWLPTLFPGVKTDIDETACSSCQKLLFSATLTRDPAKIAQLELRDPKYFIVRRKSVSEEPGDEMEVDADATVHEENFDTPALLRVCPYPPPSQLLHSTCRYRNGCTRASRIRNRCCCSIWFTSGVSRMPWFLPSRRNPRQG